MSDTENTLSPALIHKMAEAFCSFMDGDENYDGTPCSACIEVAEKMAKQAQEELYKDSDPSDDDPAEEPHVTEVPLEKGTITEKAVNGLVDTLQDEPGYTLNKYELVERVVEEQKIAENFVLNILFILTDTGVVTTNEDSTVTLSRELVLARKVSN